MAAPLTSTHVLYSARPKALCTPELLAKAGVTAFTVEERTCGTCGVVVLVALEAMARGEKLAEAMGRGFLVICDECAPVLLEAKRE